ncbi:MAG: TIGR03663 family protein, partial [Chloroflexota bacterium]|nr:TIGR03663 family protein [Chloroflexota bacterium]
MGQATPPAKTMPPQTAGRHNQTEPLSPDVSTGGNGHRSFSRASDQGESPRSAPGASPGGVGITLETAFYAVILVLAALIRFWDLGSRALHHDESLHAYFSWLLATGQNYAHDPLMHGPFLFHFTALVYAILGDSDASSRYSAALFGVLLVALPLLLRGERHLGRWGALTASAFFLISPSLLYQSRYIRHDIFTVVGTLFLFIAIMRYIERPSRGWLVAGGATLGFLLTNHEIVFAIAAIFFGVLLGALLWGRLRPVAPLLVLSGIVAVALIAILPEETGRPLPSIPWSSPSQSEQFAFYQNLLGHPLTIALALLAIVTFAAAVLIARGQRDPARIEEGWAAALLGHEPPGSVAAALREVWRDRGGLSWALIAGMLIFAVLFTTLFTNLYGLASGTIATDGTLLYWLGQHDVQRGEQPWFYYLVLLPQYEFLAALFGVAATIVVGVRTLRVGIGRATPGPRFVFQLFLALWFAGITVALSFAGEKMPWLVTHITLPAILLAAAFLSEGAAKLREPCHREYVARAPQASPLQPRGVDSVSPSWSLPQWALCGSLLALAVCWFLLAAPMSYGEFVSATVAGGWERVLTAEVRDRWWLLAAPVVAGIVLVVVAALRRGARQAAAPALAALVLVLALAQVHVAWR